MISRLIRLLNSLLGFIVLMILWQVSVDIFEIRPYLLPSIMSVAQSAWEYRSDIFSHSLVTTVQVIYGFGAAVIGGIIISLLVFVNAPIRRIVMPVVIAIQGIPKVALAPLFVVWFGYGTMSKVLMAFFFAFFPIIISTLGGFAGTPVHLVEHFRALDASTATTFWRLRVPSALPNFIDGCKMAMPLAVIGVIVGEFVGSEAGLGNLLLLANASARTDLMFASIITITAISGLLYGIIHLFGRLVWWRAL